jgi:hypothetical protein
MFRNLTAVTAVALATTLFLAAGGIAGAQDKCAGAKEKATGKLAGGVLGCDSKAAAKSVGVDPGCVSRNTAKFDAAFGRAEAKGGCNTTGDGTMLKTKVTNFAADVFDDLYAGSGADRCAASKLKATGKKASGLLGCHAKAAAKGIALDPGCIAKVEGKYNTAFGKAEAKGGCNTMGDATAIETKVDSFVNDVVSMLQTPGTTTTSNTTLPTTSSTTTSSIP